VKIAAALLRGNAFGDDKSPAVAKSKHFTIYMHLKLHHDYGRKRLCPTPDKHTFTIDTGTNRASFARDNLQGVIVVREDR